MTKIYTTIYSEKTIYTTATEHDVSTKVQYATEYVTTTALSTYTMSYPVTITTTIDCEPPYKSVYASTKSDVTAQVPKLKGRTYGCRTTTLTSWATTTATKTVTEIESVVTTQTVPRETTIHDTHTLVDSTTIWVPTTYTATKTVVSEHPVTLTVDNTRYTTKSTTVVTTFVSTVTTSFPVVTTMTLPGQTVTAPGETVTAPGQTQTVTAPGGTSTITLPAVTRTLPGSTVVTTQMKTLPPSTIHVTDQQATKTITRPGYTVIETSTLTIPPTSVEKPATTVTVTPLFDVTLCPTPTGASAPLDTKSNRTFGCEPGFVCNPPKPNGCNLWPEPPADDFLCDPNDCIPSPPFAKVAWEGCETSYYPPSYGYFNLNPEAFGLSYDIFEYKVINTTTNGHASLVTTGNWASQSSLTAWPKPSPSNPSPALYRRTREPTHGSTRHKACRKSKRAVTPAICFDECSYAYIIAESTGKSDRLCKEGSDFRNAVAACYKCIDANSGRNSTTPVNEPSQRFEQYLEYCRGSRAEKPPTALPTTPEQLVTQQPTIGTSTQVDVSHPTFTPISSTQSTTPSAPSTRSPTGAAVSTSPGDTRSSQTTYASTSSGETTQSSPSSGESSSSALPGSTSAGSSVARKSGTSNSEETSSPTATHTTALATSGGGSSRSGGAGNTAVGSGTSSGTATGSVSGSISGSGSGSGSGLGSSRTSGNGQASGTGPRVSESTSDDAGDSGSGQVGATTGGAPGNSPSSSPTSSFKVSAAASRLTFSAGAILVSSVLVMMY
ncbi:glycoprotein X [Metarhizium album ARSEF 1941]|uniref:Glycoprotein X n=1 Tax=Metarhizium album (strain ARSEF 1941) TaxID=1081103 RepID=A0A0B2WSN0_METAS|nr:glycoprotein X [Metarhizium album ARSEF 1941]KHN97043.1 glycoprotein X [Metarhizium album ARSEF 1941]